MSNRRDLSALKARLERKVKGLPPQPDSEFDEQLAQLEKANLDDAKIEEVKKFIRELAESTNFKENQALKQFIRDLYQDAISCEDARDFIMGAQESLETLIRSWGEAPQSPQEYMEAQQVAEETAKDERDFARLKKKLGK